VSEYRLANAWSLFAEGKVSYSHLATELEERSPIEDLFMVSAASRRRQLRFGD
jgi:hypothetical protein